MKKLGRASSTFGTVVAAALVIGVATTGGAVAGGLITSKQIKNNTIKSIDVRDGALKSVDITNGTILKSDLAASTRGYTTIYAKRATQAVAAGASVTMNVICPAGQVAIGGGGYVVPTGFSLPGSTSGELLRSLPSTPSSGGLSSSFPTSDGVAPQSWRTLVHNTDGANPSTAVHYAICAGK